MIGLKRGTVELCSHERAWEQEAEKTIKGLWEILGSSAQDIAHVGSTAIIHIKAKPIIDIAVAVNSFEDIPPLLPALEKGGFFYREHAAENDMLFVCGDFEKDMRTHHIHVVKSASPQWINYINFRDYMNAFPEKAKEYESLKLALFRKYPTDRVAYTDGKAQFITAALQDALVWASHNTAKKA